MDWYLLPDAAISPSAAARIRLPFLMRCVIPSSVTGASAFKVDVKEMDDHYELTADLPGMKKEDVALHYENGYLTVAASHSESKDEKDEAGSYIRRERHTGEVSRSFYIDGIDEANIHAEFKDGVLQVKLPKAVGASSRKQIEIH